MSFTKRMWEDEMDRNETGYQSVESRNVCLECFENQPIKNFIKSKNNRDICHFCESRTYIADINDVIDYIFECINYDYISHDRACGEYGMRDSETGGFINLGDEGNYSLEDILYNEGLKCKEDVFNAIIESETDSFHLEDDVCLSPSTDRWGSFSRMIKHKRRFFFNKYKSEDDLDYKPISFLKNLSNLIVEFNLKTTLQKNKSIFRARAFRNDSKIPTTKEDYSYCPCDKLESSTRMTPLGIEAFYGSFDRKTAINEINYNKKGYKFACSEWKVSENSIQCIDFTKIENIKTPDFFTNIQKEKEKRNLILIFKEFSKKISKKIEKDNRDHIEYLPTQVLSEFLKVSLKIDGIIYKSTIVGDNLKNIVLFPEKVKFLDTDRGDKPLIFIGVL